MVELVQDMVDVDREVSMRAMAREVGCSDWLVRTIVKEKYSKVQSHILSIIVVQTNKQII